VQRIRLATVLVSVGLCSAFSGCGGGGVRDPIGQIEDEVTVCAKGPTVEGIDVSYYQGTIDWAKVKASGRVFAIARISDGTYMDTKFDANWPAMKSVGLIRGAYQFFEPATDPIVQANIVISKVGKLADGDLPVTCDVEATGGQSAATIISHLHTWMDAVEKGTGKKPIIYTGKYFWQDNVANTKEFNDHILWIAAYGPTCPNLPDAAWSDWKFFQYTDKASVSGISGGVDGDKFNGTLEDLQKLAGGGADYAAQFVSQSWPYATTSFPLVTNQALDAYIEMKNVGKKAWDSNTRLGTTVDRDRKSPFSGSSWLSETRLAQVEGTVPPGGTFKFKFKWHAPAMPGSFDEHFGLVQDGVTWFGDQGGPADGVIEAKIDVVKAKWAAEFVSQSFPTSDKVLTMHPGDKVSGTIELKNIGTETWKAGETKIVPTPRDTASPLASSDWLSPTRISSPPKDVAPGESYAFPVTLTANQLGDTMQTFGMVEEGVAWFADSPDGGGPTDDFIKVHVVVENGVTADGGVSITEDAGVIQADASGDVNGGCGCETTGKASTNPAWLLVSLLALTRRRRSH
jgi:lysozyme